MGLSLPKYFLGISIFNPLILDARATAPRVTWAGGLVNDNDGPVGVAYIFGAPPMLRGARFDIVCIWFGGVTVLDLSTSFVGLRAHVLITEHSTYSWNEVLLSPN